MSVDSPAAQPATPDILIEQCLTGDQVAWDAIVRQNWRKVFNVAYKFVGKHDEELPDRTLSVRYRFVHVLYQNVLYASLQPTRRASLSRRSCSSAPVRSPAWSRPASPTASPESGRGRGP